MVRPYESNENNLGTHAAPVHAISCQQTDKRARRESHKPVHRDDQVELPLAKNHPVDRCAVVVVLE